LAIAGIEIGNQLGERAEEVRFRSGRNRARFFCTPERLASSPLRGENKSQERDSLAESGWARFSVRRPLQLRLRRRKVPAGYKKPSLGQRTLSLEIRIFSVCGRLDEEGNIRPG
jgi:hypothetical protein